MKNSTKLVFVVLMVLVMALAPLVACTKNNEEPEKTEMTKTTEPEETTEVSATEEPAEELEYEELVWLHMGPGASMPGNPIVEEALNGITLERFNTEIDYIYIDWLDYVTQYNLQMASGAPMDLVYACSWLDVFPNAQKGAFLELDELLPEYAPRTWADVTEEQWNQCRGGENDKIILLPKNNEKSTGAPGMFYRGDWAVEAGLTEDITTIEELEQYWDYVKNNKPGVIPWNTSGNADSNQLLNMYMTMKTDYNATILGMGSYSIIFGKSTDDPYTVVNIVDEPFFLEFANLTKKWGNAGYWPEDLMGNSNNWYDMEQILVGTSATYEHHANEFFSRSIKMEEEFPGSDPKAFLYPEGSQSYLLGNIIDNGCAIAAQTQDAARSLMIYDAFRFDEDLYKLSQYGVEDVHYSLNEDGLRYDPVDYNADLSGFDFSFWGLRSDDMYVQKADEWEGKAAWVDKIRGWQENYPGDPYLGFVFDGSAVENELKAVSSVVTKWVPVIMFGKASGTPEEAIAKFSAELNTSGMEVIMAEVQSQIDAFVASK